MRITVVCAFLSIWTAAQNLIKQIIILKGISTDSILQLLKGSLNILVGPSNSSHEQNIIFFIL